jgi:predicted nucleic acid-binding protein
MLYLDTSALLKLYIREQGSEAVQARVVSHAPWRYRPPNF